MTSPGPHGTPRDTRWPGAAASRAIALVGSTHPGPTVVVTVLAVVLGASSGLPVDRLALLALAVLLGQASIGFANDWLDAGRDRAVGRTDKPVAQGRVSVSAVRTAAVACGVLMLVPSYALGPAAGTAHLVLVASGWAYDLGLKRTPASVVPFVVSFGLLPAVATLAASPPAPPAAWAVAVGGVFGVAIHFTNVLPDLEDDARTGIAGLPHRLGRTLSGITAFVALGVATVLLLSGQLGGGASTPGLVAAVVGSVVTLVIALVGMRLVIAGRIDRTLFRLIMVAALLLVVQLALSGGTIVA
ncbi:UbiA family prenyltransferase [Frigoribacterium sp. VKM Ac-2836]|uniref:UbiA family prenyltransferase n=1 Tax=Frigoribacterium sp. VKM Ac-2836 TaxID=2739014 RepID=UPI001565FBB9|nr:UbiA family prenyltransferase [Frigoribacterium sp. VKM Ac-2836]NRD25269.1 UbiA family prenyltransferase [Frigoribacterium sp. VKM Ac-2836]